LPIHGEWSNPAINRCTGEIAPKTWMTGALLNDVHSMCAVRVAHMPLLANESFLHVDYLLILISEAEYRSAKFFNKTMTGRGQYSLGRESLLALTRNNISA
jgi:hypothetical protein